VKVQETRQQYRGATKQRKDRKAGQHMMDKVDAGACNMNLSPLGRRGWKHRSKGQLYLAGELEQTLYPLGGEALPIVPPTTSWDIDDLMIVDG